MAVRTVYRIQSLFVGASFLFTSCDLGREPDWFSLTLTTLLAIDAIVLPLLLLYLPACNPDKNVPRWIIKIVNPLDRFVAWVESKQLGAVWMKIIGALWAFFIYLVPVYIGGQLAMAVVVALIYDVLIWATMQV